ncbi:class I SAM-dependent methyltransferase [Cerasicoccus frondis]|uniref:class I SAM-dependent methyltransferase n=1 Tax=Cerasicoccus frondis TaxID=490090 RepID=UPI002852B47C|nr:class I SAM-dependent methyltransferase [Cerasicoccus frondis]
MEIAEAQTYFQQAPVVDHYARAVSRVGLWKSEELIFKRIFQPEQSILELGCGAGRIGIGLWELGYRRVLATDYCQEMVAEARRINQVLEYGLPVQQADATNLQFADGEFDGAIFGFNGLMQIPGRENRLRAMHEISRVLKPGAWFTFTGHDRNRHGRKSFWREESKRWVKGRQNPMIQEFGDLYYEGDEGYWMYIHAADSQEVQADLEAAGFRVDVSALRSEICMEPAEVREFSDDTRFWVVQKL